jgi:dUTP pyrophosphatase
MIVKFKKLHEKAVLPSYAKKGDAGLDMTPVSTETIEGNIVCSFGLAMEIPDGYMGLIFPRSSIYKFGYFLSNAVGVWDCNFRGEVKAIFKRAHNYIPNFYNQGVPVCQLVIIPYPTISPTWSDELSETERGEGGFGHTSGF